MINKHDTLRRLIDLPGVRELEYKAVLKRDFADLESRSQYPEIDDCVTLLFGLTTEEAESIGRPGGWDEIETKSIAAQVSAFEAEGWDVTDDKRRPLRMLAHFSGPLWLAGRGGRPALPAGKQRSRRLGDKAAGRGEAFSQTLGDVEALWPRHPCDEYSRHAGASGSEEVGLERAG